MIKRIDWIFKTIVCDSCGGLYHNQSLTSEGVRKQANKNHFWHRIDEQDICSNCLNNDTVNIIFNCIYNQQMI